MAGSRGAQASAPYISEKRLLAAVRELARVSGWLCYHTHDSRRSEAGFPDLVLARGGRVVFAELKSERGRLRPEQRVWLDALAEAEHEVHLWRPADWENGKIASVLGGLTNRKSVA